MIQFGTASRTQAIDLKLVDDEGEVGHATPDADGGYVMDGVVPGAYVLTASRASATKRQAIELAPGGGGYASLSCPIMPPPTMR